jgi:hypothetical protein
MKTLICLAAAGMMLLTLPALVVADPTPEQKAKQAQLDAACEAARAKKITWAKQVEIDSCVKAGDLPDRESCERYFSDYGSATGARGALFYDLPECQKAYENLKSY